MENNTRITIDLNDSYIDELDNNVIVKQKSYKENLKVTKYPHVPAVFHMWIEAIYKRKAICYDRKLHYGKKRIAACKEFWPEINWDNCFDHKTHSNCWLRGKRQMIASFKMNSASITPP